MDRPPLTPDPAQGLLRAEHFQVAYATSDPDRAWARFAERYGIRHFATLEGQLPAGGQMRVDLAWVGTVMYELMHASGPGSAIYMDRLPAGPDFAIRHHHLGYLIDGEAAWQGLMEQVSASGHRLAHLSENTGFMTSCFVDAPELGHYLEYIRPEPAGAEFLANVPRN